MSSQHIFAGNKLQNKTENSLKSGRSQTRGAFLPFQWNQHSNAVWHCAIDFILLHRQRNLIGDVFGCEHWEHARLDTGEHARCNVIWTHQSHVDVIVAMRTQFGEQCFVESNAGEFRGAVVCAAVCAEQTGHRCNCHDVTPIRFHHLGKEGFGRLRNLI